MKVNISACGLNVAYHMSILSSNGVVLYNVVKQGNKHVTLVCNVQSSAYVQQYLTNNNFRDIIVNTMGLYRVLTACRNYWVLCVMLLLLVPILIVNSMYCHSIVVEGDMDSDTIINSLSDIGITVGSRLSSIDYDDIEDYLSSTHELSYTIVSVVGNTLYVNTIATVKVPTTDYTTPRDIVASASGVVTSISVVQGSAVVAVGDYVNCGDTLISGVRTYTDGTTTPVYAIGTVYASVAVSSTVQYTGYAQQYQYTGNSTTVVAIDIGNISVVSSSCSYQYYDVTTSSTTLYPLAIDITYMYYVEKLSVSVPITYDSYLEYMKQQALIEATSQAYFTVTNTVYSAVSGSSVTVTLQGNIIISNDAVQSDGG